MDWKTTGDTISDEHVLVFETGGQVFVYPQFAMNVEVVNDEFKGLPFAITYCPLTGSGISFQRVYNQDTLLLSASGYLYQDNLMPWDSISGSIFSQMLTTGVRGNMAGMDLQTFPLLQIRRRAAYRAFPAALVFESNCNACLDSLQAVTHQKTSSGMGGELRFGILGLKGVATFGYGLFADGVSIQQYLSYLVVGSESDGFIMAFQRKYNMTAVDNQFPIIMQDDSGGLWNVFGEALSGPHQGEKLSSPTAYVAHAWAWEDLFGEVRVY